MSIHLNSTDQSPPCPPKHPYSVRSAPADVSIPVKLFPYLLQKPGGLLLNTDTVDSPLPSPRPQPDPATWEHRWFILQVSNGLLSEIPPSFPKEPSSPVSPVSPTLRQASQRPNPKRWVPIHAYCMDCVLKTLQKSMFNNGFSHSENMLLAWTMPKWMGHGPWSPRDARLGGRVAGGAVSWCGTASQRARWENESGMERNHLLLVRTK